MVLKLMSLKKLGRYINDLQENLYDCPMAITGGTGCQPKGSKVLMADGSWKNIEDIKIGDYIVSPQNDGTNIYSKVIDTTNWFSEKNYSVFEINRGQRELYHCSYNHLIPVYRRYTPRIKGKRLAGTSKWEIKSYEAEEYNLISKNTKVHKKIGFSSFLIERYKGRKNCSLKPYTLGVYLGDGSFYGKDLSISNSKSEVRNKALKGYDKDVRELEKLGLKDKRSGDKFIPEEALLSDAKYRKELLAGLVDTDGYCDENTPYSITTKSKRLADDIVKLVYSLGGRANITPITKTIYSTGFTGNYFFVSFYLKDLSDYKVKKGKTVYLASNRIAIDVKPSKAERVYGFELDSPSKLYITDNWMITHNTGKSTLAIHLARKMNRFHRLSMKKDLLYSREELIRFYTKQELSTAIVDEAINTAHNRSFYDEEQKQIVKLINMNRDKRNCSMFLVPSFGTLDNQLRQLFRLRLDVVKRGYAILHLPRKSTYSPDKWDSAINAKIESEWSRDGKKPSYGKLTTAVAVIRFGALSPESEARYQKVKDEKRAKLGIRADGTDDTEDLQGSALVYDLITKGHIKTIKEFEIASASVKIDPASVRRWINKKLKEQGKLMSVKELLLASRHEMMDVDSV